MTVFLLRMVLVGQKGTPPGLSCLERAGRALLPTSCLLAADSARIPWLIPLLIESPDRGIIQGILAESAGTRQDPLAESHARESA